MGAQAKLRRLHASLKEGVELVDELGPNSSSQV